MEKDERKEPRTVSMQIQIQKKTGNQESFEKVLGGSWRIERKHKHLLVVTVVDLMTPRVSFRSFIRERLPLPTIIYQTYVRR